MNDTMFARYYAKYFVKDKSIQKLARKLAKNDRALFEELVQIGLITLWKLNPKNAITNEDAWIRQAMKRRMIDFLRKDRPKNIRIDSLDARLAVGDQLEKDPESGQFHLIECPGRADLYPRDLLRPQVPREDNYAELTWVEEILAYMDRVDESTMYGTP